MKGRDVGFQTTKEGEFWRILLPGIYTMEVFAEGFRPREVQFAIVEQNPTLLNVTLQRDVSRRKDAVDTSAKPVKVNSNTKGSGKDKDKDKKSSTSTASSASSQEFDEDIDDEIDKKDDSEEEKEATGLFGFTNPFAKIQSNVKNLLNKIPLIG